MPLLTGEELREVISVKMLSGDALRWAKQRVRQLNLDSRSIRAGDLFIAIRGDRFDGHDYVAAALSQGAVGAIVHDSYVIPPALLKTGPKSAPPFILGVRDPLFAYQQLATHHRSRFDIPLVAVTGSNGKTTTKDMVASVIGQRWRALKTESNFNNRIGVPHTLLGLTSRHEAAVIEMGVDNIGQTTRLSEIARPTIGIITNIGPDHLEFFGGMEGSVQAKAELLDLLPQDGTAILNADDSYFDYLASRARCRVVSFGYSTKADVQALHEKSDGLDGTTFRLLLPGKARHTTVSMKVQGSHNVANALAAAAVGLVLGLSGAAIAQGLARFRPAAMRSQIVMNRGIRVINDCYNANPASMKAAVQLLAQSGTGRTTIAVLGDMLELGPNSMRLHEEVGAFVAQQGISRLIASGTLGRGLAEGARRAGMEPASILEVADAAAAAAATKAMAVSGDVVLVKASRGMKMEQVVNALQDVKQISKKAS